MTRDPSKRSNAILAAFAFAAFAAVAAPLAPADAQRNRDREEEEESRNRTFSAKIGQLVAEAQEAQTAGDLTTAMNKYNAGLATRGASPYEIGIILILRGNLYYELDQAPRSIEDWERALREGDLTRDERMTLNYNIGQIQLSLGNYRVAIQRIEQWINDGGDATDKVHLNLVAAYSELDDFNGALRHGRAAFDKASPRERKHYDVLNYLFTELNMPRERAELLQEMVTLYPTDKKIWTSIAALHAQAGRERKAFEINKIMYLNGMLEKEDEIMRIVDYYSYYEVPYRGAKVLEREMNRGRVANNPKNQEKLARLYRQAREWDAAIAPLTKAAEASSDGKLYQQLGEAFYAEGRVRQAETSLLEALRKGGIQRPGNVWMVVGNARYEGGKRDEAIKAFEQAAKYQYSVRSANGWIEFINGEIAAESARKEFEAAVRFDELRVACERRAQTTLIDQDPIINAETGEEIDCDAILEEALLRETQAG